MKKDKWDASGTIFLPTTEKDFESLVKILVKKYKLPDHDHAAAVLANEIQHLPREQATTTLEYLGHCILKNISYQLARSISSRIGHKTQCDQLGNILKANPNDQQARDSLEKAVKEGSEYAAKILAEMDPTSTRPAGISYINCQSSGEDTALAAVSTEPA